MIKIYQLADDAAEARQMLMDWAGVYKTMNAKQLKTIGETVAKRLEGIFAYWEFDRLTNSSSEVFNNKTRHLISEAYGYRDYKYLKLRIYELPSKKLSKQLHSSWQQRAVFQQTPEEPKLIPKILSKQIEAFKEFTTQVPLTLLLQEARKPHAKIIAAKD